MNNKRVSERDINFDFTGLIVFYNSNLEEGDPHDDVHDGQYKVCTINSYLQEGNPHDKYTQDDHESQYI